MIRLCSLRIIFHACLTLVAPSLSLEPLTPYYPMNMMGGEEVSVLHPVSPSQVDQLGQCFALSDLHKDIVIVEHVHGWPTS